MKTFISSTLLFCIFSLTSFAGFAHPVQESEKIYLSHQHLYFSEEGIFFQTPTDHWIPIHSVSHDENGYYINRSSLLKKKHEEASDQNTWVCPKCRYKNDNETGVCDKCLWPLYEWDYD